MTSSDKPCKDCEEEEFHGEAEPVKFIIADEKAKRLARKLGPDFERLLGLIPREDEESDTDDK